MVKVKLYFMFLFILLITTFLVITGCTSLQEKRLNETDTVGINATIEQPSVEELPEGVCSGKFICISSKVKAYQLSNCSIGDRFTCKTECVDGTCKEEEIRICTPGFKCKSAQERGFQRENCAWEKREKCEFSCNLQTNRCNNQTSSNQTITSTTTSSTTKTAPTIIYPKIAYGETAAVSEQNLTIYAIETDRVILKLGSQRSDWLEEGQQFTFKENVVITVQEILFQPYEGGKREVVYSLG